MISQTTISDSIYADIWSHLPVPYLHVLALLLTMAVRSIPKEKMTASSPFIYSHWNWWSSAEACSDMGVSNSPLTPWGSHDFLVRSWSAELTFYFASKGQQCTLIASWKKRTVINMPNNSSASLVNFVITVQALKVASKISMIAVHTQTLKHKWT